MEAMHDLDSADERHDIHTGFRVGDASESTPRWDDDTFAAGGVDTTRALNTIKDLVLADPEPEKVLGLLEDVRSHSCSFHARALAAHTQHASRPAPSASSRAGTSAPPGQATP